MEKFTVSKMFKVSPDKDSKQSKTWTLELTVPEGTTMKDLATAVLAPEVIKVQNANRSKFDKFADKHVFRKTFAVPGYQVDPKEGMRARLAAMTKEEREAEVASMLEGLD